ncbi:MAG: hypothetical protein K1X72_04460 [Pyrinomonadaceae bacterium]|nr:hypothetical protein [Pyrinomonadaceae bacterium]
MKEHSKVKCALAVKLTPEQLDQTADLRQQHQESMGLVIGSLGRNKDDEAVIALKLLPNDLGQKIINLLDEYYAD